MSSDESWVTGELYKREGGETACDSRSEMGADKRVVQGRSCDMIRDQSQRQDIDRNCDEISD